MEAKDPELPSDLGAGWVTAERFCHGAQVTAVVLLAPKWVVKGAGTGCLSTDGKRPRCKLLVLAWLPHYPAMQYTQLLKHKVQTSFPTMLALPPKALDTLL